MQTISSSRSPTHSHSKLRGKLISLLKPKSKLRSAPRQHDQRQSILFNIPPEIRALLWRAVIGDRTIHIARLDGRAMGSKCSNLKCDHGWPTNGMWGCWGSGHISFGAITCPYNLSPLIKKTHSCGIELDFLVCCRRMQVTFFILSRGKTNRRSYHEAIGLLYTTNTISVRELAMVSHVRSLLPPSRLDSLTSVHLSWKINWHSAFWVHPPTRGSLSTSKPEDQPSWGSAWQLFSFSFMGLKRLTIELRDCGRAYHNLHISARWTGDTVPFNMLLGLLEKVGRERRLEVFDVWVPRGLLELGVEKRERSFTLRADDGTVWEQGAVDRLDGLPFDQPHTGLTIPGPRF